MGGNIMTAFLEIKLLQSFRIKSLALAFFLSLNASQALAQDDSNTVSKNFPEHTMSFATVNPYTKVAGSMTIVFTGLFHATKPAEITGQEFSRITGNQKGTFTFVPDDPSQPTISGQFHFNFAGTPQPHSDSLNFAFRMEGLAPDGSRVTFVQTERAVVGEAGVDISFGKTEGAPTN
jgi:hypothetical protein